VPSRSHAAEKEVSQDFSAILEGVQSALGGGGSAGPAAIDETRDTMTLTRMLADGTMIIQKVQGKQVVSETEIDSHGIHAHNNNILAQDQFTRAYTAGIGIAVRPTGSIFSTSI
jgi:hypothetical protein